MSLNDRHSMNSKPGKIALAALLLGCSLFLVKLPSADAAFDQRPISGGKALFISSQDARWQPIETPFAGAQVHQLLPDADRPHRLFAATDKGLFISRDSGSHWLKIEIPSRSEPNAPPSSVSQAVFSVARVGDRLFIGTQQGLLLSRDGGQHWARVTGGIPMQVVPLAIAVAADNPNILFFSAARHGVFRSRDGGDHWQAVNEGLPQALGTAPVTPVYHLVIDPSDPDTVYAATEVEGIYATRNGGESWEAVNRGLPIPLPYRTYPALIAFQPQHAHVLFTLIGYPVHSHKVESKLYRSTDDADHWEEVETLPENVEFHSLTFNNAEPNRLFIGHEEGVLTLVMDEPLVLQPETNQRPHAFVPDELLPLSSAARQAVPDFDVGNIAVLHDDGTLMHLFDLNGLSIQFVRASKRNYTASLVPFAFDATPGQPLSLADDDSTSVDIPFPFQFYGGDRKRVFVNSNGNLTFSRGNSSPNPSLAGFIARVSVFWTDLDPSQGGSVTFHAGSDRLVITWSSVPDANSGALNTFQVILLDDNRIIMNFVNLDSRVGLTGVTPGTLFPSTIDFTEGLPVTSARRSILEFFDGAFEIDAIGRRFYQTHPDDFDFLVVFGASSIPHDVVSGAFAFHAPIQNDVAGIGITRGEFNGGPSAFGSSGRLQSFLNMNKVNQYPDNPSETFVGTNSTLDILAQESGHRWLAFVYFDDGGTSSSALLGRGMAHWSFFLDTDASELEGNRWLDNGNGTFTTIEATSRYSPLDRYLMGLAFPAEVPSFFLIKDPSETDGRFSSSAPEVGVTVKGTRQNVTVSQIITAEGTRFPSFPFAPTQFNQAFLLVVPQGDTVSPADLNKLETIRRDWEVFFSFITGGRGTINTRLPGGTAPDLAPTTFNVSPTTVTAGATVNVSLVMTNQGSAVAGSAVHEIRFSNDSFIDNNDIVLATLATNPLAPGSSSSFSFSVNIPSGISPGQKFIGVMADAGNAVVELNEVNNVAQVAINVTGGGFGADLTPLNFSVSPTTLPAGGVLTINVTILNQGSATAPRASHEIRLSNDSVIDGADPFLAGFTSGPLAPGATVTFSVITGLPGGTTVGGKFVGVMADALNQVAESDEGNNTASVFINVTN